MFPNKMGTVCTTNGEIVYSMLLGKNAQKLFKNFALNLLSKFYEGLGMPQYPTCWLPFANLLNGRNLHPQCWAGNSSIVALYISV